MAKSRRLAFLEWLVNRIVRLLLQAGHTRKATLAR